MSPTESSCPAPALRHELRTPVNVIVGYCEMLLESADAEDGAWRAPLEDVLAAVRDALALINAALPPNVATIPGKDVDALRAALRPLQRRIVGAVQLLSGHPAARSAEAASDLDRIARAAEWLTQVPGHAAVPSAGPERDSVAKPARAGRDEPAVILVVDDIEENRDVLARRLRRQGHSVLFASNGVEALATIAGEPVDVVLLDVMMPQLDGFAVLERLRASPDTRDLPVIMISALDDLASAVRCIEQGADDYLAKPFDPVILRARVGACVERKRARDRERDYLQQVASVIAASLAVEEGRYVSTLLATVASRADEVGRLARVFDRMAGGIRAREARLNTQLGELRREIELARGPRPATAGTGDAT